MADRVTNGDDLMQFFDNEDTICMAILRMPPCRLMAPFKRRISTWMEFAVRLLRE